MLQPQNDFSRHLHKVLTLAGYGVAVVDELVADGFVDYLVADSGQTTDGPMVTYQLSIDDVKIKRDYIITDQHISPASSLFVKGADPSNIRLNDHIFETGFQVSSDSTQGINGSSDEVIVSAVDRPAVNVAQPTTTTETTPAPTGNKVMPKGIDSIFQTSGGATRQKGNVYDLGASNYSNIFANYTDLSRAILTFGNDEYRVLGKQNKAKIMQLVGDFQQSTDIFSVIGCSHGTSNVVAEGGDPNALLALGRASRVKEELLIVGIPEEKILDEGCWSVVHYDDVMPRRGVVVSLKRSRI